MKFKMAEGSSKMNKHSSRSEAEKVEVDIDDEFLDFVMKVNENFAKLSVKSDKEKIVEVEKAELVEEDKEKVVEDDTDTEFMRFITQMKKDLSDSLNEENPDIHSSPLEEQRPRSSSTHVISNTRKDLSAQSSKNNRKPDTWSSPLKNRSHSSSTVADKENVNLNPIEIGQPASHDESMNIYDVETEPTFEFAKKRKAYGEQLYRYFNRKVFNYRLPADMPIKWSDTLRTTAGFAHCARSSEGNTCTIELSTKVNTSFDRLRDTLLHEMCHCAVWIVNNSNCCHGPLWQTWATRCKIVLPQIELPTRCHNYKIAYKFTYKCSKCRYEYGRHSRSVNIQKVRCPWCHSSLVLIKS